MFTAAKSFSTDNMFQHFKLFCESQSGSHDDDRYLIVFHF